MSRMLYKHPGPIQFNNGWFDTLIVADTAQAIAAAQGEGWHLTSVQAYEAAQQPAAAPVIEVVAEVDLKAELTTLAESLGIKVDGRWSIARLRAEIDRADGDE